MSYFRVNEKCNGCLACVRNCPARALDHRDEGSERVILHNMARCARCATCWRVCPEGAVKFRHMLRNEWDEVVRLPLVRCSVCGAAVHTARLAETLEGALVEMVEPLCDRHREVRQAARIRLDRRAAS